MADIIIASAKVVGIKEMTLTPTVEAPDPKTVAASELRIEPKNHPDPRIKPHGTIWVAQLLPYGVTFDLVLRDQNMVQEPAGRKLQDE